MEIEWHSMLETIGVALGKISLLIILYFIVKPLGQKVIERIMTRAGRLQRISDSRVNTLSHLLINIYKYVLVFVLFLMILGTLQIPIGPLLAGAGIAGLAIGFGAQGLVSDVVTGFFILVEDQIHVDDYVTVSGLSGVVEGFGLRSMRIRDFDGTLHYIPNRNIDNVSNHSRGNMQALVDIKLPYTENLDRATDVLQTVCDQFKDDLRVKAGPDVIGVTSMESSTVTLRIIAQTEKMEQWAIERALRQKIKEAIDESGIELS